MSITVMKQMVDEMEYVLSCINENKVPFDGDDFHEALRLGRQAIAEAEKQEPMKLPLPCDVKVGHVTIRKGVALSVLVSRMQVLYNMAQASPPQRQPLDMKTIKRIATYCDEHITDSDVVEITRRVESEHGINGEA